MKNMRKCWLRETNIFYWVMYDLSAGRLLRSLCYGKPSMYAIVCTGEGTRMVTLIEKVKDFKTVTGDFPMYEQGLLWSQYGTYVRSR